MGTTTCSAPSHRHLLPPIYLCHHQCIAAPQLLDAAPQQLRCPPETGHVGMQFLWVDTQQVSGASSGAGGQPACKEEKEQCQARAGNAVGHWVKSEEEGSVEVDGQLQAGAGRRGLPSCTQSSPFPSPLLGFPIAFPGM